MGKRMVVPDGGNGAETDWRSCPSRTCGASFDRDPDDFVVSGDGDWTSTVVCKKCMHVRERVPDEVLVELLVEQFGGSHAHVTPSYVRSYLITRRRWWEAKVAVEERLD